MRQNLQRYASQLGLWAMLLLFAAPLFSQIRALEGPPLALIDLRALHCGAASKAADTEQPAWINQLEQCGYCQLLLKVPPLPHSGARLLVSPLFKAVQRATGPERGWSQLSLSARQARGPPSSHSRPSQL